MRYVCDVCGYVYDEETGDPTTKLLPAQSGKSFPTTLSVLCAP